MEKKECPSPAVLAAFVGGRLKRKQIKKVTDHLSDCDDCRVIIADAARVDRDMMK